MIDKEYRLDNLSVIVCRFKKKGIEVMSGNKVCPLRTLRHIGLELNPVSIA